MTLRSDEREWLEVLEERCAACDHLEQLHPKDDTSCCGDSDAWCSVPGCYCKNGTLLDSESPWMPGIDARVNLLRGKPDTLFIESLEARKWSLTQKHASVGAWIEAMKAAGFRIVYQ